MFYDQVLLHPAHFACQLDVWLPRLLYGARTRCTALHGPFCTVFVYLERQIITSGAAVHCVSGCNEGRGPCVLVRSQGKKMNVNGRCAHGARSSREKHETKRNEGREKCRRPRRRRRCCCCTATPGCVQSARQEGLARGHDGQRPKGSAPASPAALAPCQLVGRAQSGRLSKGAPREPGLVTQATTSVEWPGPWA